MSDIVLPPSYAITNLLTADQQTFAGAEFTQYSVSGWFAGDDGDGPTCELQRSTQYQKFDPASMRVDALTTDPVWLATEGFVAVEPGTTYRGFAWVRSELARIFVRVGIEWATVSMTDLTWSYATYTESEVVSSNGWTLIAFEGVAPTGADGSLTARRARLRVELVNPTIGDTFWVDDAVITDYITPDSPMLRMARRWIPEYLRLLDGEQTAPTVPMERFFDLTATTATRFLRAALAFDFIPESDGVLGYERSTLVDARYYPAADYAEERWLDWLAYLTGCRLFISSRAASTGFTPWYLLEDNVTDWTGFEGLGSWDDLENAFPQSAESAISKVTAIRTRGTGLLAGTIEGMRRAARLVLGGFDKAVTVERVDGVGTATFLTYTEVQVGDELDLYDTGVDDLDARVTVTGVSADRRTVTFVSVGADVSLVEGYMTSSLVNVLVGTWSSPIAELTVASGNPVVTTTRTLPRPWQGSEYDTAAGFPNSRPGGATFTFAGIDITFDGDPLLVFDESNGSYFSGDWVDGVPSTNTFAVVWDDYIDPISETNTGLITIENCGIWCITIETVGTQTTDPDVVLNAVEYAKPAGCILTHRYTAS